MHRRLHRQQRLPGARRWCSTATRFSRLTREVRGGVGPRLVRENHRFLMNWTSPDVHPAEAVCVCVLFLFFHCLDGQNMSKPSFNLSISKVSVLEPLPHFTMAIDGLMWKTRLQNGPQTEHSDEGCQMLGNKHPRTSTVAKSMMSIKAMPTRPTSYFKK